MSIAGQLAAEETERKVLIVDDEPHILSAIRDLLEEDFSVLAVTDAQMALRLLEEEEVSVILSDQRMPGLNGDQFLREAQKRSRATRVLITGYADLQALVNAVNEGKIYGYVAKPWEPEALRSLVSKAADYFTLVQDLEQEQIFLHTLMDHIPDHIYFKDTAARFTRINKAMARALGLGDPGEAIGKTDADFLPESAPQFHQDERRIIELAQPLVDQVEETRGEGGEIHWYSTTKVPLRDKQGAVTGLVGISRDITQRKQTEAGFTLASVQLQHLFDNLDAVLFSVDVANQRVLQISPACEQVYGVSQQAFVDDPLLWRKVIHPEDVGAVDAAQSELLSGKAVTHEYRILRPDGGMRWVTVKLKPTADSGGQVVRLDGIVTDITARKRAEEETKVDLALQQVRNKMLEMTTEIDWNQVVLVFYAELRQMVGFNQCGINLVDLRGNSTRYYTVTAGEVFEETVSGVDPVLSKALATGACVYRPRRTDPLFAPTMRPEINSVVDVPFSGGTVAMNSTAEEAFTARDIEIIEQFAQVLSEAHRRLEDLKTLAQTEAQLRQAQKLEAVGRLAGGIAHDFNNLLTIIDGYSALQLRRMRPGQPQYESLQEIQKAADRGAGLVRQLLAFSRKQILEPTVLDLNTVVKNLEKMLHRLIGEDVELVANLASGLGQVKADPGQVEQVLMNLAINARDAMPRGGTLLIETRAVDLDKDYASQHISVKPGAYVLLEVSDTGIGMDAATQAQIFEPFFTTKAPGGGTGLGLATVYGIIKQSGGYIWVYSEPGKGTSFKIYLPQITASTEPVAPRAVSQIPRGSETVLLVEDEKTLRELVGVLLREVGYTVVEAGNGPEALRLSAQRPGVVHLIVTDMVLPGMSGRDLVGQLTALRPGLKVLYMSGYSREITSRQGVLEPGTAFLQKPFKFDALLLKVREVLDS